MSLKDNQCCYYCRTKRPNLSIEALEYIGWTISHLGFGKHEWVCSRCAHQAEINSCDHSHVIVQKDIGIDIYPTSDGDVIEERRHLVRCKYCGARQAVFERRSSKKGDLAERRSEWRV